MKRETYYLAAILILGACARDSNSGNPLPLDLIEVRGSVMHDENGNGIIEENEKGLDGWTVFIDLNENGTPDLGEPSAVSVDDYPQTPEENELGTFSFPDLEKDQYSLEVLLHPSWVLTLNPSEANGYTFGVVTAGGTEPSVESNCNDEVDNDEDGNTDCADSDCEESDYCADNDGDGYSIADGDTDDNNPLVYPGSNPPPPPPPGSTCGDGNLNAATGEECDDGNTASADGCSATCTIETLTCGPLQADTLFVTAPSDNTIYKEALVSGSKMNFMSTNRPYDIAINHKNRRIYWTDGTSAIYSASLSGGGTQLVLSDPSLPGGISLDLENDKIYWTGGNWNDTATAPIVLRANMDGSNVETLVNGTVGGETICCNMGIALDVPNEKIYWMSEYYNGYVMQSDLDGHNPKKIANTVGIAANIAVDSAGQYIYWVEYGNSSGTDRIMRASLDGSNVQVLILGDAVLLLSQIIQPRSIALDVVAGKLYVADVWGNKVVQANLNGTGMTIFMTGVKDAYGLALDGPNPCTYQ